MRSGWLAGVGARNARGGLWGWGAIGPLGIGRFKGKVREVLLG